MRKSVRIAFHGPEQLERISDTQRLCFGEQTRRRAGDAEVRPAVDTLYAIRLPELKRIRRAEFDGAESVGRAEEIQLEDIRRWLVETPVGQRNAWIDRLKPAFEIEKIGAVPGQESRRAMRLRQAYGYMHVAEIREPSQALIVELGKCCHEAIAFSRCQGLGVLADTHHHRRRADQRGAEARLDPDVAIVDARLPEFAGREKRDRRAVERNRECQAAGERARAPLLNSTAPPLAADTPLIFTLTVGVSTPEGLVTRMRHGDGDHERNPASGAVLLLICNSTFIVMPSKAGELGRIHRRPRTGDRYEGVIPRNGTEPARIFAFRNLRNNVT